MHGAGNDFIFLNNLDGNIKLTEDQIRHLCHRRFGIGCDQLLLVASSSIADFRMDIYNSDGGMVEMCGNGIRCFAKYVLDLGLTQKEALTVETMAGIIKPVILKNEGHTGFVRVDMGEPILNGQDIPVNATGHIIKHHLEVTTKGISFPITCVSMGNPHCVIEVERVLTFPVEEIGPEIENHPFFPNRVNTEFIEVLDRSHIRMRVWERGAGETYACGTGACAVGVAGVLNGITDRKVTVHLKGGDLEIEWNEDDNHVYMTGPATTVFEGKVTI